MTTTVFQGQTCFVTTMGDLVAGDRLNAVSTGASYEPIGNGKIVGRVERAADGAITVFPVRHEAVKGNAETAVLVSLRVLRLDGLSR